MSKKGGGRPKDAELRCAYLTEHIRYERQMLGHTFGLLHHSSPGMDWNVAYESFGIHARNLYQFLRNSDDQRSNFRAQDYVSNRTTPPPFGNFNDDINCFIFHLSTRRVDREKLKLEDLQRLGIWLDRYWREWVTALPDEYTGILDANPVCTPQTMTMGVTPKTACTVVTVSSFTAEAKYNVVMNAGKFKVSSSSPDVE